MKPQEAFNHIKQRIQVNTDSIEDTHKALHIIQKLVDKATPKKFEVLNGEDICPTCRYIFGSDDVRKTLWSWKMDFCVNCGQALDWSDTK